IRELLVFVLMPRHDAALFEIHVSEHHPVAGVELPIEHGLYRSTRHLVPRIPGDVGHCCLREEEPLRLAPKAVGSKSHPERAQRARDLLSLSSYRVRMIDPSGALRPQDDSFAFAVIWTVP